MSNILFKSDIADTLDYNRSDMALSARQGLALKNAITKLKKTLLLEAHPVGSLYWSLESTNPASLFGGTWVQIKDRFIWATTSNPGGTGGSQTKTLSTANLPSHTHSIPGHTHSYTRADSVGYHTVSTNEMPSHNHDEYVAMQYGSSWPNPSRAGALVGYWDWSNQVKNLGMVANFTGYTSNKGGGASHNHGLSTSSQSTGSTGGTSGGTGSGTALNIMPPFLEAYCWKRTA